MTRPAIQARIGVRRRAWLGRWVAANAVGEFVGLGAVAALSFALFSNSAGSRSWQQALLVMLVFVALGALEGLVVGLAQGMVLRKLLPQARGWVGATMLGAMVAWAVGMLPSTIIDLLAITSSEPPPEPPLAVILALAAALGAVAGPILAAFQWRSLRRVLPRKSWMWLPANALAWALGMPLIFLGAQANEITSNPVLVVSIAGLSLLLAGAMVGLVHGMFLIRVVPHHESDAS